MTSGDRQAREMRPIYWGSALTIAGICSLALLSLVAFYEHFIETHPFSSGFFSLYGGYQMQPMPPFFIILMYIAKFAIYFSLPLAIAIEAYRYLKGRKGEV